MSHAMQGHPRWTGHVREFWQNMIHWRREQPTTPVFLPQKRHVQNEKAKRYDTSKRDLPDWEVSNMLWEKNREIAPGRMKRLGQSQHDVQLWMCLLVKVKSDVEQYCVGTWTIRSMNQGKLDVVKQEMARLNINVLGIRELKWTGI